MTQHTQNLGRWAEQRAISHLMECGFTLIQQNFHSCYGEIDSILVRDNALIFLEVKARQPSHYGMAHDVISLSKQKKIMRTAVIFLQQYPQFYHYDMRFDVLCIDFLKRIGKISQQSFSDIPYHLEWIENAFTFDLELITL